MAPALRMLSILLARLASLFSPQLCCTRAIVSLCIYVPLNRPFWQLHGDAVQRAVLPDQREAVNPDHPASGKRLANGAECGVIAFVPVGGNEHGAVYNQEIGVGSRKAAVLVVIFGFRPGEGNQAVRH